MKYVYFGILLSSIAINFLNAQPGTLDLSFGTAGRVSTIIGSNGNQARNISIQNDGKIVTGGTVTNSDQTTDFSVTRYLVDGTIDVGFGVNGTQIIDSNNMSEAISSIAIQSDGKIVLGGYTGNTDSTGFLIARINSNGSLDNTFGINGKVVFFETPASYQLTDLILDPNGKILVVGQFNNSNGNEVVLARFNSNGTLDTFFGLDGIKTFDFGTTSVTGGSVRLRQDGKILLGVSLQNSGTFLNGFVRCNPNGSLDNTFGINGIFMTNAQNAMGDLYLLSDNRFIISNYGTGGIRLEKYNEDGTYDNSFGTNGVVTNSIANHLIYVYNLAVQADGKILVSGFDYTTFYSGILVRYTANGVLDNSFDNDGIVYFSSASSTGLSDLVIQNDGKIVVCGSQYDGQNNNAVLFRLQAFELGIEEVATEYIHIYPNPCSDKLVVKSKSETIDKLELYNLEGKLVYSKNNNSFTTEIDTRNFKAGTYLIKFHFKNHIESQSIVVE